ncbi:hypothetical protein PHYPSEUDO_008435 [Phytophthora pseudosyringae]|uniref:Uncharacterized protein n=1 Tax=Phytophthora pseudosyringae TaxID=221518 RepID=A0A8T1VH71_9STRA|nr:hypothetical protein PHYPSEUDO_008435 [Phytophthora pseudosyringae]
MEGADMIDMTQRWGFLAPWCRILQHQVHYTRFECEGTAREDEVRWESKGRSLQVTLPKRTDFQRPHLQHEATYQLELAKIREALAVLAAVAHVDPSGWKELLLTHCQVNWWKQGEEDFPAHLPARFVLLLEDHSKVTVDVTKFCGVDQREQPSAEFAEAMRRIAEVGGHLTMDSPGVDVEIPVRVAYGTGQGELFSEEYKDQLLKGLTGVARAEKAIRRQWERYYQKGDQKEAQRGSIRCTFALEPMVADVQDVTSVAKTAGTLERLLFNNVWFSLLSVRAKGEEGDQSDSLIAFRQLMIAVFDGARRGPELSNTRYRSITSSVKPLQLGSLVLHTDLALDPLEIEALFSAAVLNQTTQKLSVWVDMSREQQKSNNWWKWLAYGCFSKRARTHSALQSLDLSHVSSISVADVEMFLAIVDSEHPEELLFECPRGSVEGREATLKDGAMVQYDITDDAEPRSLTFTSCRFLLHTFGDDGSSEWVNVIVPGFGRCRVRRSDLVFQPVRAAEAKRPSLTSLTLRLYEMAISNGLPRFLAAIGSSLRYLTIENPGDTVDPSVILRCCPNLRELTLNQGLVDVQFKFDAYRASSQAISTLRLDWENVAALATTLSNTSNPLVKSVSQLRVRLTTSGEADSREYDPLHVRQCLEALLAMLNANMYLVYLEVSVSSDHEEYLTSFRRHHHEVIGHQLNLKSKLALLSVLPSQRKPPINPRKKLCTASGLRRLIWDIDQDALAQVFAFAAEPVTRRVCFHA